jgi:hypothetical protein
MEENIWLVKDTQYIEYFFPDLVLQYYLIM